MRKGTYYFASKCGLLIWGLGMLLSCTSSTPKREYREELDPNVEIANEVRIVYTDSAKVRMILTSPKLYNHRRPIEKLVFVGGVHVQFFSEKGQKQADLWSKKATRFVDDHLVLVQDSVKLVNAEGDKLEGSELYWDEREERAYSDRFVKITKGEDLFFGYGFEAKDNFKTFTIRNSTGRTKIKKQDTSRIEER